MKQKTSIFLLVAFLMVGFMSLPAKVSAAESSSENINMYYYTVAKENVEKYYRYKDLGEVNDLSVFEEGLQVLLNAKIAMDSFQRESFNLKYDNYEINVFPFNETKWSETENDIYLLLQVERKWYYSSEPTTMSEVLEVTISKETDIIVGCYNTCESITYGPIDEIYQNAILTRSTSNVEALLNNYVTDFESQCIQKEKQMTNDLQSNDDNTDKNIAPISSTTLSRTDIKTWARDNYNKDDPSSSSSSVPYYDFSQISGAYDCTNFVSHALLAGGATLHDNGGSGITGTDQWYYRSTSNRSSSWAGVNQLYTFLTRSKPSDSNKGPYATDKTLNYDNAFIGDIVQGHNGSIWRHSTVVTKFENKQVYVTGRTSPGSYNDNQLATTIYGKQRLLHLEGNYSG